jgi:hypothetical protein
MLTRLCSLTVWLIGSTLLYVTLATPAQAYLDPGTGSMVLQVLLGGLAGLALAGRYYWHRILVMLGFRSETPPQTDKSHRSPTQTQTDR